VRTSPRPLEKLLLGARYCSQPLFQFALELEGRNRAWVDPYIREVQQRRREMGE
jgi:hypothetical protein